MVVIFVLLKKVVPILLLLLLTAGDFFRMGFVANYLANLDFYKNELCENKQNKKLKCNGMCQLSKEIGNTKLQNEQPGQEQNNSIVELKEPLQFLLADYTNLTACKSLNSMAFCNFVNIKWDLELNDEIFHPPCV